MTTITKNAFVPGDNKLNLEVELPVDAPTSDMVVTVTVEAAQKRVNRMAELEGRYKGRIWMAEDFDAPLEDSAEYR